MPIIFTEDPLPVENPGERHVPAVLLLDISGSMSGKPIEELEKGLYAFGEALKADKLAYGRAEVCIYTFSDSVECAVSFRPAAEYAVPKLSAGGCTSLNQAILAGLDALEERKRLYKSQGVSYYRPWLFVLTDGGATDSEFEAEAKRRLCAALQNKGVVYMPMGIGEKANREALLQYYPPETGNKIVLKATAENFQEAFVWLSQSIGAVAHTDPSISQAQGTISSPTLPNQIEIGV